MRRHFGIWAEWQRMARMEDLRLRGLCCARDNVGRVAAAEGDDDPSWYECGVS